MTKAQPAVEDAPQVGELRIGEVAKLAGCTTRTIRYYEEIGLLPESSGRVDGKHRMYTQVDVDRLVDVLRLKNLLGLTLDELKEVVDAEEARAALRAEFHQVEDPSRRGEILNEALGYIERQLELVHRRRDEMKELENELSARRRKIKTRLRDLAE